MDNRKIFTIGTVSIVIFIGIAAYLWYLYFNEYESKLLSQNGSTEFTRGVELTNSGNINYLNANTEDDESIIPAYYFRVKNNSSKTYNYALYIENATSNDGCTPETTFSRNELEYELKLDNVVIKSGNLGTIQNNLLDSNTITGNSMKDYSLRIWLNESIEDYGGKHFHYTVTMKEQQ